MSQDATQSTLVRLQEFDFGKVYFHNKFLITEINEGVNFDHSMALQIASVIDEIYADAPYAYIANRKNSFSVNPPDYRKVKSVFKNLKLFCIVTYTSMQKESVKVEQIFYHDTIHVFDSLEEAIVFIDKHL
ncbi:hypothetical protein [Aquimarina brevivitae]|uniref:SpoIIAA-like protein n=1 Tax=Aquimarina brevivitae TaxID=323412 RepID=A0A4Q7P216_9FLAO|nr:hypothetical protein [Aquimarina brevivitae]RZS93785.1 hypothetical protein EV197_2366 [Aquimarina brevivitae]